MRGLTQEEYSFLIEHFTDTEDHCVEEWCTAPECLFLGREERIGDRLASQGRLAVYPCEFGGDDHLRLTRAGREAMSIHVALATVAA